MPLNTLDQAPLKNAFPPSSFAIFFQQSIVPLYMISAVENNAHKSIKLYAEEENFFLLEENIV